MKKFFVLGALVLLSPIICLADTNYTIKINNIDANSKILDNNEKTYIEVSKGDNILIESENINGLYIIYEKNSITGTINANDKEGNIGENNYLHEFINVKEKVGTANDITISYDEKVYIAEIYVIFDNDNLPDYVEIWENPCEKADLLLFSTHSDDEQLFFLGLLPTYVAKGAYVQVVYFTNHNDNPQRLHEQLHGLYAVGIRNYPIFGIVPDAYSTSLEGAIKDLNNANLTENDALKYEVENIRRFKPQVVVGHDEKGEYSHGQHILNTYILEKAIIAANDENEFADSYDQYGSWGIKKLYLHLYEENQITMDYDTPLEYFDGKTAYEVSKVGYSKHLSQQWTWFTKWINGKNNEYTKATEISTYSPLIYGLYYSVVGEDNQKNDMFENITYYKDLEKKDESIVNKINNKVKEINNSSKLNKNYIYIAIGLVGFIIIIIAKKRR